MPLVQVRYDARRLFGDNLGQIFHNLPGIIAKHLTVPGTGGEITEKDISVWMNESNTFDHIQGALEIVVFAGWYEERAANLDQRKERILADLDKLLTSNMDGFVWILLVPENSFGEI